MKANQDPATKFDTLRRQAERLIQQSEYVAASPPGDMLELIHELQIHQVELQIQNEELKRAQQEVSKLHREYERLYEFAPCGYVSLNAKGIITHVNLTGVKLLGAPRKFLLRSGFGLYIGKGWQDTYRATLKKVEETGENQSVELQLSQGNRHGAWIGMQIQAQRDETGRAVQWQVTFEDISSKKTAETALLASEEKHRALFSTMVSAAAILEIADRDRKGHITDLRYVEVNKAFEKITGLSHGQVKGRCIREIWPKTESFWFHQIGRAIRNGQSMQVEGFHEELGKHFLLSAFVLDDNLIGVTFVDISAQIKMQETLDEARKELAIQVDRQTADLLEANQQLRNEVGAHKHTQAQLLQKTEQLKVRQARLEEANAALKVLLRTYDAEHSAWEEMVISNIEAQTRPYLSKLATANLSQRQRTLLEAVNRSLDDITSPLNRRLVIESIKLTPSETQVAKLIRQGKPTKEISNILGVATSTIEFHRHNIRKKLNLSHQNLNLQSYLQSLE